MAKLKLMSMTSTNNFYVVKMRFLKRNLNRNSMKGWVRNTDRPPENQPSFVASPLEEVKGQITALMDMI